MWVALTATIVAVALFAVPLAVAVRQLYFTNEQGELERSAFQGVSAVGPSMEADGRDRLPHTETDVAVGLYGLDGHKVTGDGPALAPAEVTAALTGRPVQGKYDGFLVSVVPVLADEKVIGAVRAATPIRNIWARTLLTWGFMLGLGLLAVSIAVLIARRQARQLSAPLEGLAASAHALGDGDFATRAARSDVPEIDETAAALDATAVRLGLLVDRERQFSANASHQLRTPLTGLRLRLESALDQDRATLQQAAEQAIASADELERTIAELLALARKTTEPARAPQPAGAFTASVLERWQAPFAAVGRSLTVTVEPDAPASAFPVAAAGQVLDVLLENALGHGSGAVDVVARDSGALAIDVRDKGHPPRPQRHRLPARALGCRWQRDRSGAREGPRAVPRRTPDPLPYQPLDRLHAAPARGPRRAADAGSRVVTAAEHP